MAESIEEIMNTLDSFVKEVIGEEWADEIDVTMDTSFSNDLEMESIEVVLFAEKVKEKYGDKVDFVRWLSTKELDQIINLTVGEVVEYIHSCLSSPQTE